MNFNEVLPGLLNAQKTIHPKYLYDEIGSEIFEEICLTEDYYPTRAEKEILHNFGAEIAELIGDEAVIIEPGSGASEKIRILLPHLIRPAGYIPVEISSEILERSAKEIRSDFPELTVTTICTDFMQDFNCKHALKTKKEIIFFPGSTIGNLDPIDALMFLKRLKNMIKSPGGFLIGVDTKKPTKIFEQAYDDSHGVTARFNLNLLARMNRELEGDFKLENFSHMVCYDEDMGRVEMHLKSLVPQYVRLRETVLNFMPGETIHTESSYKYAPEEFEELGRQAGLMPVKSWEDSNGLFRVYYFNKE